jgi:Tfp pilus assembly protein PilO
MKLPRIITQDLGWALLLLVVALLVDFAWVRPGESELSRLETRKKVAERQVTLTRQEQTEWEAMRRYFNQGLEPGKTWRTEYETRDPLRLLEDLREASGLRRIDLRLQEREPADPFVKTTYFMSVNGGFERQIGFLKALEEAQPLVTVESFLMETPDDDRQVTLRMTVSVLSLAQGESS